VDQDLDALYLSPHLDDAALSCGGQIHAAARTGKRVLIATLHTADPPGGPMSALAEQLHGEWGLGPEAMAVRREEDRRACKVLGAELRHEGLLDALYRRGAGGDFHYDSPSALRGPPAAADLGHLDDLARVMKALPAAERTFAPLAAGGHVDHRLTRRAAEAVYGKRLTYYEDYPYVRSRVVLAKALRIRPWRFRVVDLEEEDLAAKVRAIACYATQLSTAFADEEDMARQVGEFYRGLGRRRKAGGERLWRKLFLSP
jgi:LmbE family N-acetylglucosaminyl deacetylase